MAILKAVSDINLDPGYTAMYLEQSIGPAKRVLDEILSLAGYLHSSLQNEEASRVENKLEYKGYLEDNAIEESINETPFTTKTEILSEVWLSYRDADALEELYEYSDLGFPIAYAYSNDLVQVSEKATKLITETFTLLLSVIEQDTEKVYENLEDFLNDLEEWLISVEEDSDAILLEQHLEKQEEDKKL